MILQETATAAVIPPRPNEMWWIPDAIRRVD
jgi:hypothetical protein